jgi:hypothetical protein
MIVQLNRLKYFLNNLNSSLDNDIHRRQYNIFLYHPLLRSEVFYGFPQSLQANEGIVMVFEITTRSFPSTSFPINSLPNKHPIIGRYTSLLLKASLNKSKQNIAQRVE